MVVRDDILPEELSDQQAIVVEKVLSGFGDMSPSNTGIRLRQPNPAKDVDDFVELVYRVITEQQITEEVPTDRRIKLLHDFPPGDIETEVITFGLIRRTPASMSQGQHFNQRVMELKPHIRSIEDDPLRPGYKVVTLGQKFENELVLTCWAKTNKQANIRARWLEDTLRNWTWYIRYEGIEDFYFMGQDADVVLQLEGTENKLMGRPLRYYIRTHRLSHVLEPTIRRIVVKYGLGQSITEEE